MSYPILQLNQHLTALKLYSIRTIAQFRRCASTSIDNVCGMLIVLAEIDNLFTARNLSISTDKSEHINENEEGLKSKYILFMNT